MEKVKSLKDCTFKWVLTLIFITLFTSNFKVINAAELSQCDIYNVRDYGAKGDSVTLDTKSIQAAIDDCSKQGGGTVLLSAGTYLSGTLHLKSNITLHIQSGAVLLGSTRIDDYSLNSPELASYNDSFLKQSLIYGENLDHVSIEGDGIIDGQGGAFKVTTKVKPDRYKNRPYILRLICCRNVRVENITLQNSAMWMQHYLACENLSIRGIKVYNHCNQNNDMMDIDGCKNVVISDCIGDTDDDGLTLKSTSGRITENVTITNCILSSHCNALKCGTESHGGFKNIVISNILVKPSKDDMAIFGDPKGIGGIVLAVVDGGLLDNVNISNVRVEGVRVPLFLRLGNRARTVVPGDEPPGVGTYKNVKISHVTATGADSVGCSITGLPGHPVRNVELSDITISFHGGVAAPQRLADVPENETFYPESTMFGTLPAYGFYLRHAENISLSDIDLSYQQPDERPALLADDVNELEIDKLKATGSENAESLISLINTSNVYLTGSRVKNRAGVFVRVSGKHTGPVYMYNNKMSNTRIPLMINDNVPGDVVQCLDSY